MILIDIDKRDIHLTREEQSLATGSAAREALRPKFLAKMANKPPYQNLGKLHVHEAVIIRMITKYSEQMIYQPLSEMRYWFAYSSGAFIEPGYPPLFYSRQRNKTVSPNKSAVAGIGEGVAGLITQRLYKGKKLARPNHDFPDIVIEAGGKTYLVESKATLSSEPEDIKRTIADELPKMAAYVSSCSQRDTRPVVGLLVGTTIISETNYQCYLIEVTV